MATTENRHQFLDTQSTGEWHGLLLSTLAELHTETDLQRKKRTVLTWKITDRSKGEIQEDECIREIHNLNAYASVMAPELLILMATCGKGVVAGPLITLPPCAGSKIAP